MASRSPTSRDLKDAHTNLNGRNGLARSSTAPAHPSPLRETSPVEAFENMKLNDGPATPHETGSKPIPTGPRATRVGGALNTPPDSNARDERQVTTKTPGAMGNFSYANEDPFVTPSGKELQAAPTTATRVLTRVSEAAGGSFSPREDRIGKEINSENAQGVFDPKACVFVANLSNAKTDEELEKSVHNVYDAYGKCWVKIRRDRNKMPFAFVQYETIGAANEAINKARGVMIDGRSTRCEHAKVNRALYLTRHTGGSISEDEARTLLEQYGAIELATPISIIDQHLFSLPEGIMVQFAYFQDARDAQLAMRRHDVYRVFIPQSAVESRGSVGTFGSPSPQRFRQEMNSNVPRHNGNDACSIFVGELPHNITKETLADLFREYGQARIDIISKPTPNGGLNTFAFLNFDTPEQAEAALYANITFTGEQPRIERKQFNNRRYRRNTYDSPPANNQEHILSLLYHSGMELGLPHDQALRILNVGQRASIDNGPQGWPTTSPINPSMYTPPFDPHSSSIHRYGILRTHAVNGYGNHYPYQMSSMNSTGYHPGGVEFAPPSFPSTLELEGNRAAAMHTIVESDEVNATNHHAH